MSSSDSSGQDVMSCQICMKNFDPNIQKPLVLIPCGHTLCSQCQPRVNNKCPFDNTAIASTVVNFQIMSCLSSSSSSSIIGNTWRRFISLPIKFLKKKNQTTAPNSTSMAVGSIPVNRAPSNRNSMSARLDSTASVARPARYVYDRQADSMSARLDSTRITPASVASPARYVFYWQTDSMSNAYEPYKKQHQDRLNEAYREYLNSGRTRGQRAILTVARRDQTGFDSYAVVFDRLKQLNQRTGFERNLVIKPSNDNTHVQWSFWNDLHEFQQFDSSTSKYIEECYLNYIENENDRQARYRVGPFDYVIDFKAFNQVNLLTRKARQVERLIA